MGSTNESKRYYVTHSPIGWTIQSVIAVNVTITDILNRFYTCVAQQENIFISNFWRFPLWLASRWRGTSRICLSWYAGVNCCMKDFEPQTAFVCDFTQYTTCIHFRTEWMLWCDNGWIPVMWQHWNPVSPDWPILVVFVIDWKGANQQPSICYACYLSNSLIEWCVYLADKICHSH